MQGIKKVHDKETRLGGVGGAVWSGRFIEVYTETERMGKL